MLTGERERKRETVEADETDDIYVLIDVEEQCSASNETVMRYRIMHSDTNHAIRYRITKFDTELCKAME